MSVDVTQTDSLHQRVVSCRVLRVNELVDIDYTGRTLVHSLKEDEYNYGGRAVVLAGNDGQQTCAVTMEWIMDGYFSELFLGGI